MPRPTTIPRGLLTVDEAAEYLGGLSAGTVRNWVSMKRIDHVKIGRLTRIPRAALDRYILEHTIRADVNE